jgi:coproporphyrinogen III oxidase-like Fe-S oxidoreductase
MPDTVRLSGREVKEIWRRRFLHKAPEHRFWLYTHIPFCPQICSFCQCSTSLRKSDEQVAAYLRWLEGEIDFFAEAREDGLVKFQYVGGGTPNLLTEPQLERLLGKLNRQFRFDPTSRRTFEFLPSALRPDTLSLVRSLGFNRLSCGVQSWSRETLKAVNRSQVGLEELGRTIQDAYDLGYDEFNVDLIHGIGNEAADRFCSGLLEVLSLRPTTVTIHHIIPTPTNPVFSTVEEELGAYVTFEGLETTFGEAVARRFPHVEWLLRPNSWILADRQFRRGTDFSSWYYSDNERIHIDMLGLGRFAHSNILGEISYENLSLADLYDPDEASYRAFRKSPSIDAALDLITDLVGDGKSDLAPIARRYGAVALGPLLPVLERLRSEGHLLGTDDGWQTVRRNGVFIDPFWPFLDAALPKPAGPGAIPMSKDTERGIRIGTGEQCLLVFIEKIDPQKSYFSVIGNFGIYYRDPDQSGPANRDHWVEELMRDFVSQLERLLEEVPKISLKQATARLKQLWSRPASQLS